MAQNPYVNKVIYVGNTLIDLTEDTITENTLMGESTIAIDGTGKLIRGTELGATVFIKNAEGIKALISFPSSMARVENKKLIINSY